MGKSRCNCFFFCDFGSDFRTAMWPNKSASQSSFYVVVYKTDLNRIFFSMNFCHCKAYILLADNNNKIIHAKSNCTWLSWTWMTLIIAGLIEWPYIEQLCNEHMSSIILTAITYSDLSSLCRTMAADSVSILISCFFPFFIL